MALVRNPATEAGQPLAHLGMICGDPDLIQDAERGLVDSLQAGGRCEEADVGHMASCLYSSAFRVFFSPFDNRPTLCL
jgi:hypothetical protein